MAVRDGLRIRAYEPARDAAAVRGCMVELQEFERALEPDMPAGDAVVDAYLARMFERGARHGGVVLVAELAGEAETVGFVSVWTRFRSDEPDENPEPHGFVSDLVVTERHRGAGIGRALLHAAEARAREAGAPFLRLGVKAANAAARRLYAAEGFREVDVLLRKPLA